MNQRIDIDFNFVPHPLTGDLAVKTGKRVVVQTIKNVIETSFYERGFNVGFGTNVRSSLFELHTPLDKLTMADFIREAVRNFEPNLRITDIEISNEKNDENTLTLMIKYTELSNPHIEQVAITLDRLR